ncbi:MAG: iron-sulfur cluster assembly accessory protein [archaeon]
MEGKSETQTEHEIIVSGDMTIGEAVRKFPETIEIMSSYGLHCVGCGSNYSETIEEGAMGHGMPEAAVSKMLAEMNEAISGREENFSETVCLTAAAAEKIRGLMKKEGKEGWGLKVSATKGGCSGNTYVMDFQKGAEESDIATNEKGLEVYIARENHALLKGIRIDYVEGLQGAGFKIVNPNASHSCGCGQSFH